MSMPSIVLRCDTCDQTANTCMLHQNFQYWYKGMDVHIARTLGFCRDCDSFAAIESFDQPRTDETSKKLESQTSGIKGIARKLLASKPGPRLRKLLTYCFRELSKDVYYLEIVTTRRGDERCLRCLSRNITKFDGDINLRYDIAGIYVGRKPTGFRHPGCGGEFVAEGSEIRFAMSRCPIYFEVDLKNSNSLEKYQL